MIKPIADLILKPHQSRYSLVVAVAKRARLITEEQENSREISEQKPVERAVQEFVNHKYTIIEQKPQNDDEN